MPDMEKVIKEWEAVLSRDPLDAPWDLIDDTLTLLKEQEAVKPKCKERMGGFVTGLCPTCGTALNNVHNVKACGKCGQAVKWE